MTRAAFSIAFFVSAFAAAPALATEFYVAINMATDSCHVVIEEPDGEVMKSLGGPYSSYDDAAAEMKKAEECGKEGRYR